jgi:hypothetical protein
VIFQRGDRIYYCCDACPAIMDGHRLGTEAEALRAMRQAAVLEGWLVKDVGGGPTAHLCPGCAKTPLGPVTVHLPYQLSLALDLLGARYDHPVSSGYLVRRAVELGARELGAAVDNEQEA